MNEKMLVLDRLTQPIKERKLTDAIQEFLFNLRLENRSPKTLSYYSQHLGYFLRQPLPDYVHEITPQHIKDYLQSKQGKVYMMHGSYRALRSFFNWSIREGYYGEDNPVLKTKAPKLPQKAVSIIGPDDFKKLVKFCNDKFIGRRDKAIILILYDTGIRLQELAGLKVSDIDLGNGLLKVLGKGNKERMVRIGRITIKALWYYLKVRANPRQELWLTEERRPIQADGIAQSIRKIGKLAGMTSLGPHRFRHSFAVNFLRNGGDPFSLQILLGHSDLEMVRHYTSALKIDDALASHEKFSPVDRLSGV